VSNRSKTAIRAVIVALACVLVFRLVGDSQAQEASGPDWEHLENGFGAFSSLWTPASGAFLANSEAGAVRSDDGGLTWRRLPTPPALEAKPVSIWDVNSMDHRVYYVSAEANSLFRTADDGVSWSQIDNRDVMLALGADPDLLYRSRRRQSGVDLERSRDGGATWEPLKPLLFGADRTSGPSCSWSVRALYAHPSDPNFVYFGAGCYTTKDFGSDMSYSADGGDTWSAGFSSWQTHPSRLAGGHPSAPDRLYLLTSYSQGPSSLLHRSDDRGATWNEVAHFWEGQSTTDLVTDPSNPDRVFVRQGDFGFKVSTDGGITWEPFAGPPEGISHLAVGVDGKYIFASNRAGLYRQPQS